MTRSVSSRRAVGMVVALVCVVVLSLGMGARALARGQTSAVVHQTTTSAHTISVSGHGEATSTPDKATITVGVQTKGTDAQSALASNAGRMNSVMAALASQGVPADHIKTTDLSIYQDSQSNDYLVSHQLILSLDNVAKVGQVLDAAVAAGANNSWGVQFGLKDASAPKSQALTAAIADARKKADTIAAAVGATVTGATSVSEASYNPPIPFAGAARAAQASTATQVQPGQLVTSADVNVVYTFG